MLNFSSIANFVSQDPAAVALAALIVLAIFVALLKRRNPWLRSIQRKPLLTANETEFFHRLQRALPAYQVFPQVSFAAFLTDKGLLSRQARWSVRARFDRKIADFVICERGNLSIVALVELDDRTHVAKEDRRRDAITKAAGFQTLRFQSRQKPTESEIAELFRHTQA